MKRKIIKINEALCNGCGNCTTGCSEGALQIIDGKAKLVREDFCDGFGDCIGTCTTGALTIEERESVPFDEDATKKHLLTTQGEEAVNKMEEAQKKHQHTHSHQEGCPGSRMQYNPNKAKAQPTDSNTSIQAIPSELRQWPVQLHLVNPEAPYFENSELVVLSTCSPIASADIHWKFIRGRSVVVACPKLDDTTGYVDKMASIFQKAKTPKVLVAIMEVPCCMGLSVMVKQAIKQSRRTDIQFEEYIVSLEGRGSTPYTPTPGNQKHPFGP